MVCCALHNFLVVTNAKIAQEDPEENDGRRHLRNILEDEIPICENVANSDIVDPYQEIDIVN